MHLTPRRLYAALLLAVALVLTSLAPAAQATTTPGTPPGTTPGTTPSQEKWVSDTYRAMAGSRAYVRDRVARGGTKLAINLDIDNTSLATYYDAGKPVAVTLRLVRYAKRKGVHILFNTGRHVSMRARTIAQLKQAGYPVDGLCAHYRGEPLRTSKQRCRASFVRNGFTLIANIGNRSTDFVGGNYERAFRLPDYDNSLG